MTAQATDSKAGQLRRLLQAPELGFMLEAHNGLSARIAEQAGFQGIWASGLALSAQFGVRDSNEASWTQIVDMLEFMSDATSVPILLDGDTGYGNFNNMRRLVKKLEQRNIGGVCIEDKVFPKTNSFIEGERQALADVDEFSGKIKAGKDSQTDADFCIIARVEALIAGWGMKEALGRAEAYRRAGADGILIHSKLPHADEIITFAEEWARRCPLVIVPTKYYSTPTAVFREAGIDLVIWANHMIRAAVAAMVQTSETIFASESLISVEEQIATVDEIFELQGAAELSSAQARYLTRRPAPHAIVLAASQGNNLHELTADRPKTMLSIGGKPLLRRLTDEFKRHAINKVTVVAGYKADSVDVSGIDIKLNTAYASMGELSSIACAQDAFHDDMVIVYGDLLFRSYILRDLVENDADFVVVVDSAPIDEHGRGTPDYAWCSCENDHALFRQEVTLRHISANEDSTLGTPSGRWIGMLRVNKQGRCWLDDALGELQQDANFAQLNIPELLNYLIAQNRKITVHYIHGHWLDVNSLKDIDRASDFTHGQSHS